MIARLLKGALGQVTPILLAALLGIAIFAGMLAKQYAGERDAAEARAELEAQRAEAFGEVMDWQRDRMRALSAALEVRDQRLAEDRRAIDQHRAAARRLERDDDATAAWADQSVPAATRRWLRDLDRAPAPAAGGAVQYPAAPGDANAGTEAGSSPQP
ncbi:hypothetical protein LG302_00940 [Halomonas organivorans]